MATFGGVLSMCGLDLHVENLLSHSPNQLRQAPLRLDDSAKPLQVQFEIGKNRRKVGECVYNKRGAQSRGDVPVSRRCVPDMLTLQKEAKDAFFSLRRHSSTTALDKAHADLTCRTPGDIRLPFYAVVLYHQCEGIWHAHGTRQLEACARIRKIADAAINRPASVERDLSRLYDPAALRFSLLVHKNGLRPCSRSPPAVGAEAQTNPGIPELITQDLRAL